MRSVLAIKIISTVNTLITIAHAKNLLLKYQYLVKCSLVSACNLQICIRMLAMDLYQLIQMNNE